MDVMRHPKGDVLVEDGLRLYYHVVGDGPDVVVIPGASWMLADLTPLASGRTLIFYDERSRGRSDAVTATSQISMDYLVRDLEAIRQHFGLEHFALLGWSIGGAVTALYALAYPRWVQRLLLMGPIAPRRKPYLARKGPEAEAINQKIAAQIAARVDPAGVKRLKKLQREGLHVSDPVAYCREHNKVYLPQQMGDTSAVTRMRSDPCTYPNEWPDNVRAFWSPLLKSMGDWDWRTRLASLRIPTLVMHGAEDTIPMAAAREWAAALPNARLKVFPGAGHYLHLEAPEAFFSAAVRFLNGEWPEEAEVVRDTSGE
jgi:pimeloyl-ACP methyl ester carboxylesterase